MGNVPASVTRVHKAAVAAAIAVLAVGMGACGSSSPEPGGAATTAVPTSVATSAAPTTQAPKAPATTTPPTAVATPTTTATTVPKTSTGKDAKVAKRYQAIIGRANAAGTTFAGALDGYRAGKVTTAQYKTALLAYIAASRRLQTSLLAVRWRAPVEALTHRIVTEDKLLVTQLKALTATPRPKLNAALIRVTKTLVAIHTLSDVVRKDLGLPAAR